MSDFIHLHNHTDYSLLDAAQSVEMMLSRINDIKMDSIAVTEHGNLFSLIPFYKAARKAGVKPILGCEVYVSAGKYNEKTYNHGNNKWGYYHLVLLAQNNIGYMNLMKLTTIGYLEGFYYKPRIDKDLLKKYNEGLIATSACLAGEVTSFAARGDYESAKKAALEHKEIFGNRFYLELQNHGIPEEEIARATIIKLSKELDIPLVATNDNHYSRKEHSNAHDILFCCGMGKFKTDKDRHRYEHEQFYIKSTDEMYRLFKDNPSAIENTVRIAEQCNVEIPIGDIHLPSFPIPKDAKSSDAYLRELCVRGLKSKYKHQPEELIKRLDYELGVIQKMGFAGYFLITQDFVQYAKNQQIPVGPGRGSAVGSLASYCLGITNIDPIKYNLIFERFLNPHRVTMPDIDIDFCIEGRDQVIQYIKKRYGEKSVAQIITFGTMGAKSSIRDVGRVLGMEYGEVDRVAKMIPNEPKMTLEKAMKMNPEFKQITSKSESHKELLENSIILEGMHRHASTHAAGVVVTPGELTDYVPLYKSPSSDDIATQYDMVSLEDLGLLKMDFLGLRNLTVMNNAIKAIKNNHNVDINIDTISLDDLKVYELFSKGDTTGIFQFESNGMREYLKQLKPTCLEDLIAMNSLYRPGPMKNIPEFLARKQGVSPIKYIHPLLEPILKETCGIIVYQEQVMQVGLEVGGLSLAESDEMRRAMGKKKKKLMATFKVKFVEGAVNKNVNKKTAVEIFDLLEKFAEYGFNKSHSTAYSVIAYQTAWLKTHYPAEFIAANMSSVLNREDQISMFINDAKNLGIEVIPPSVNLSRPYFYSNKKGQIVYGLSAIKNVGMKSAEILYQHRVDNGDYKTLFDLCEINSKAINKKVLEGIIFSGACDCLDGNRAQKIKSIETALKYNQKMSRESNSAQVSLFSGENNIGPSQPSLFSSEEFQKNELLQFEKSAFGFYMIQNPLDSHAKDLSELSNIGVNKSPKINKKLRLGGIITDIKILYDKRNNQWSIITLDCIEGNAELFVFNKTYEKYSNLIKDDAKIYVEGKISDRADLSDTTYKIIVDKIYKLSGIRDNLARTINIKVPFTCQDPSILKKIKRVSEENKGKLPLILHLENSQQKLEKLRFADIRMSSGDDCLDQLRGISSDINVKIGI